MANQYHLGNMNASLFATEGVASVGPLFAPLVTLLACVAPAYERRTAIVSLVCAALAVFVTPAGIWSERYLRWSLEVLGAERILFASDRDGSCFRGTI